jgi:transposase-like protein
MGRIFRWTEQFQHFVEEVKESFWGDLYGQTKLAWKEFLEEESRRARDRYVATESYERAREKRRSYRNGFYVRDFVTRLGTLRLRVARSRDRSFRPPGLERFQRRAAEVMLLIREAFLRGISTRQVGRVVAILSEDAVSAQTVSKLSRHLDGWVKAFQQAPLKDEWAYLFLDGVSLRVRRPGGGSGCRCWWPTGCGRMARARCWLFSAVRARARRPGKAF